MESPPSDPPKSPAKPRPSVQLTIVTPQKLPGPSRRIRQHHPLPDKYEMIVRMFDALDATLKLLRLRKSVAVFSKVRVMVESICQRRFTHQHLAQLKFLLPDEIGVGKVLFPDEETRCMNYDLHLTIAGSNKRKRGSKYSCLKDRLISRLMEFVKSHPEGTAVPENELPEPFNQRKQDELLNTTKQSFPSASHKPSSEASEAVVAQASHLSKTFNKQFSKKGLGNGVRKNIQRSSVPSFHTPLISSSNPSEDRLESLTRASETVQCIQKPSVDDETCFFRVVKSQSTPIKSAGSTMMPATPALQTPKMCRLIRDNSNMRSPCEVTNRPSCAKSLVFEGPSRNANIELQLDDVESSDILDILPRDLLQSIKENEMKKKAEQTTRKLMIVNLPKMFDRIQLLFQNPQSSSIRKEALIRNLTECHPDITDESEVEEQLKLLQKIIPEWIIHKLSPSGNKLCSINKALDPNTLRQHLYKSI